MTAAIDARESTEETGVADEQESVCRQIEHARRCADRQGAGRWTRRPCLSMAGSPGRSLGQFELFTA